MSSVYMNLTRDNCCIGSYCSDTFFNNVTKTCHSSFEGVGFTIGKPEIITFVVLIVLAFFIGYFLQKYKKIR